MEYFATKRGFTAVIRILCHSQIHSKIQFQFQLAKIRTDAK